MIYQLPNGKVINLTLEEYLDLSDHDIQFLISVDAGNYASSPWHGSHLKKQEKAKRKEEIEDKSLDYSIDDDELCIQINQQYNELQLPDDFIDNLDIDITE